jgi:hypothetical protein
MDGQADRIVAPGQTEEIKLTISTTRKRKGKFTKAVRVNTNDAKNPNPTLICEGAVKVPFEMQPSMVSFSQVDRNSEPQRRTIKITRGDAGPLAPELVPLEHENITAALREIESGESYELDVEIGPPWPNRAVQAYLTLKTGVPEVPEEKIRVYARVAPRLRSSPSRFTIPRNLKSDLDLRARLMWSGGEPGKVLEVSSSDPGLTVRLDEVRGQQMVVLHVPEDYDFSGRSRHFVTVKTDDKDVPLLRIQVSVRPPQPAARTGTPSRPTLRKLPGPPPGVKPMAPGRRTASGGNRPPKPAADPAPAKPDQPAEKKPEQPAQKQPDQPAEKQPEQAGEKQD